MADDKKDPRDYTEKPNETRVIVSDQKMSREEHNANIRRSFEQMMAKNPIAVVMHCLGENGDVFTSASGSPFDVMHADEVGFRQLISMLRTGAEAAERNG